MKRLIFFTFGVLVCLAACGTQPAGQDNPPPEPPQAEPVSAPAEEAAFDPGNVSRELFDSTMSEVQQFIENLNRIIRTKNYVSWKAALSEELYTEISSPEFITRANESAAMRTRRIVLKSPEDYFSNVVVPSRADSRVDDIEFVNENRVKAFTVNPDGKRLRLYELEKTGNTWIIIN
jgi:hypothetical protein